MKKKMKAAPLILLISFFILQSPAFARSTVSKVIDMNQRGLAKLSAGMTKEEVAEVMSQRSIIARQLGERIEVHNPYRTEALKGKAKIEEIAGGEKIEKEIDKNFEVLYYLTGSSGKDYRVTDSNLTPLVFDEGKLIGWGQGFLQEVIKKYQID